MCKSLRDAKFFPASKFKIVFSLFYHRALKADGGVSTSEEGGPEGAAIADIPESGGGYDAISKAAHATREIESKLGDASHVTVSVAKSCDHVPKNQSSNMGNQDNRGTGDSPDSGQQKSSDRKIIAGDSEDQRNHLNHGPNKGNDRRHQLRQGTYRQRTKRPRVVHADRFYPPWEQDSQGYYDISPYHRIDKARTYDKQQQYSGQGSDSHYDLECVDTSRYRRGEKAYLYDRQQQYSGQWHGSRYDTRYVDDFRYEEREPFNPDDFYRKRYRFMNTTCSSQQRGKQMISQLEGQAEEKE